MLRLLKTSLLLATIVVVSSGLFVSGYVFGQNNAAPPGTPGPAITPEALPPGSDQATPEDLRELFQPFWEAWGLVHREYVDQPLDDEALKQGAIRGMLEALGDPHTSYMNPEEYELANTRLEGELEGIGAEVDISGDLVKVISPLPGSPAEAAGILPGDVILKVDGEDMAGVSGFTVVLKVRGPAGTTVQLTVAREGAAEPLEFEIERARITIPSVDNWMRADGIAYVKINDFGERTPVELRSALKALLALDPEGLILDLRGNPGGLLTVAIEVASQFIPEGTVMIQVYGDGREEVYEASGKGLATDIPLVVLINVGSASASEIVAGAVQETGRGTLVGETSFGKGSVQNWHALKNDQGAVRVTISRWLTPERRQISLQGITPDVEVPLTEEDRQAGRDPQLDAAAELLKREA